MYVATCLRRREGEGGVEGGAWSVGADESCVLLYIVEWSWCGCPGANHAKVPTRLSKGLYFLAMNFPRKRYSTNNFKFFSVRGILARLFLTLGKRARKYIVS